MSLTSILKTALGLSTPDAEPLETLVDEINATQAKLAAHDARIAELEDRATEAALVDDRNAVQDLVIDLETERRLRKVGEGKLADLVKRINAAQAERARVEAEAEAAKVEAAREALDASLTPEALHAELAPVHARFVAARDALRDAAREHDAVLARYAERHKERAKLGGNVPTPVDPKVATVWLAADAAKGDAETLHRIFGDGSGDAWISIVYRGLSPNTWGAEANASKPLDAVIEAIGLSWLGGISRGTHPSPTRAKALVDVAEAIRCARSRANVSEIASALLNADAKRATATAKAERDTKVVADAPPSKTPEPREDEPITLAPENTWNGWPN